jgi:AbrB family looped-hinge helix DNA binding protein
MSTLTTTKMSSRGQVVIPEIVRNEMGLKTGARFVVISQGDVVMLKVLSPPSAEEFASLHKRLRQKARAAGRKQKDIDKVIMHVRRRS